ncbi:heavy-metal-associated domain-containing protein [Thioalkalivibrio sp.]|uniref:heavy-metal-associated domain-containing protein n=1 Tax=Thioalkalivibrio sp. TaxID=2093813 RepID=UPI00356325F6
MRIEVENIKCGGCAGSIRKGLAALEGVDAVEVDIEGGVVEVEAADERRDEIMRKLASMGYPATGSVQGLKSAGAKARSYVSCAVGRMDKD